MKRSLSACLLAAPLFAACTGSAFAFCVQLNGTDSCSQPQPTPWEYHICDNDWGNPALARCAARLGTLGPDNVCTNPPLTEAVVEGGSFRYVDTLYGDDCGDPEIVAVYGWSGESDVEGSPPHELVCTGGTPFMVAGFHRHEQKRWDWTGVRPGTHNGQSTCELPYAPVWTDTVWATKIRDVICPPGYSNVYEPGTYNLVGCTRVEDGICPVNNPIRLGNRSKLQIENDYFAPSGGLKLRRTYNSEGYFHPVHAAEIEPPSLDGFWRHNYDQKIYVPDDGGVVEAIMHRDDGRIRYFDDDGEPLQAWDGIEETLVQKFTGGGAPDGWTFHAANGDVETYDAAGRLLSIASRSGDVSTLEYDGNDRLWKVTDAYGRLLQFAYDAEGRIATVTLPDGQVIEYGYDYKGALTTVEYPGSAMRSYGYKYRARPSQDGTNLLETIEDENGDAYARYEYYGDNKLHASVLGPDMPGGGVNRFEYWDQNGPTAQRWVKEPSGRTFYFKVAVVGGVHKIIGQSATCTTCGGSIAERTYDASGRLDVTTDFNGNETDHDYDARGQETQRIEASGTAQQRTIETDWHATHALPIERRTKNAAGTVVAKQMWTYNARGQVLTSSAIDPATSTARTTTMTYCESGDVSAPGSTCPILGLPKTIDGPRTDVSDVTTYTYYAATDESGCATTGPCHRKGDLWKVTNAAGHVTETLRYDRAGRVAAVRDPNGIDTTMTYHARGWIATRTAGGETTTYTYDAAGQITRVTDPDGAHTDYDYDDAHRLVAIEDGAGNRIEYTLDASGNRVAENTRDPAGALKRTLSRVYDNLNRVEEMLDAQSRATAFEYDANGNQTDVTDAAGTHSENTYDPLNRLTESLHDVGGIGASTAYVYDANDRLREVLDPKGLSTEYTYDGLGNLTQLESPDTGVTAYQYDVAGNRTQQTDARSVVTAYSYDVLGRLVAIDYPSTALDVALAYDQADGTTGCPGSEPLGRLTTMADGSGSTRYCYDDHGQVAKKTQVTGSTTLAVEYRYTNGSRLDGVTLPSGIDVEYGRDAQGRITSITVDGDPLVTDVDYLPFGPIGRIAYAGGHAQLRTYDQNYWSTGVRGEAAGSWGLAFAHDEIGNITSLHEPAAEPDSDQDDDSAVLLGAPVETYAYDALSRLTDVYGNDAVRIEGYTYDDTGNRLTKRYGGTDDGQGDDNGDSDAPRTPVTPVSGSEIVETYTYGSTNHRLTATNGFSRTHDANGNTTQLTNTAGTFALTYGNHNRLTAVHSGATQVGAYTYNGRGERVRKVAGSTDLVFVYNEGGQLLGEYANGDPVREYVWMDQLPVGVLVDGELYAIEADHLGTPRRAFEPQTHATMWQWDFEGNPFGEQAPRSFATGDGDGIELPLRYPGQYDDAESGAHYNYYRDYEPSTGRYVESDPIGHGGGIATYGYVFANPFMLQDPKGLSPCCGRAREAKLNQHAGDESQNDRGYVVCCDGKKRACYDVSDRVSSGVARYWIKNCGRVHEFDHFEEVTCPPCGLSRPGRDRPDEAKGEECFGRRAQMACLQPILGRCGSDTVCRSQIGGEMDRIDREMRETYCVGR